MPDTFDDSDRHSSSVTDGGRSLSHHSRVVPDRWHVLLSTPESRSTIDWLATPDEKVVPSFWAALHRSMFFEPSTYSLVSCSSSLQVKRALFIRVHCRAKDTVAFHTDRCSVPCVSERLVGLDVISLCCETCVTSHTQSFCYRSVCSGSTSWLLQVLRLAPGVTQGPTTCIWFPGSILMARRGGKHHSLPSFDTQTSFYHSTQAIPGNLFPM